MTVQCCVEDFRSLSNRASCTIIIKEGDIKQKKHFGQQECVFITIPGKLNLHDYLSYEAYIDDDPDICYRIIYDGNKMSV